MVEYIQNSGLDQNREGNGGDNPDGLRRYNSRIICYIVDTMSFLLTFKETVTDFSVDSTKNTDLIEEALYNTQLKSYSTTIGMELAFLIWKMDNEMLKIMMGGHNVVLEHKSTEIRYVSSLNVKYVHDSFIGNTDNEVKLKEVFLSSLEELNDKCYKDYEEEDFEDMFLPQFRAICGFYIIVARNGNGVIISMGK